MSGIPLAKPVAVVVEGDRLVRGCVNVRGISDVQPTPVTVTLEDLPLNTDGAVLDLTMTSTDRLQALRDLLTPGIDTLLAHLSATDNDVVDLLTAMEAEATGSLKQEFATLRLASGWDLSVAEHYTSVNGATLLRQQLDSWLRQGVDLLNQEPSLMLRLSLGPREYPTARIGLLKLAGIDVSLNRLSPDQNLAISTEPEDKLNWSSKLVFTTTGLYDLLASTVAHQQHPEVSDVATQLARELDCLAYATFLDQHAEWSSPTARACGVDCLSKLCERGVNTMYLQALQLQNAVQFDLELNATGRVKLDPNAVPVAMSGSWIGALSATAMGTTSGQFSSP
jgi:hypothetical protein